ncbi:MAG: hypothetical protein WAO71_03595 [Gallionella sp.]
MGLKGEVGKLFNEREVSISRTSQTYTVAVATYALFYAYGPIYITTLGGWVKAAAVGATEVLLSANGVNLDAAAVAVNGAVGTVVLSSLNVAGTLINAAGIPETVATQSRFLMGTQPATFGTVQAVFSVGTSWTGEWFMRYIPLTPSSRVIAA